MVMVSKIADLHDPDSCCAWSMPESGQPVYGLCWNCMDGVGCRKFALALSLVFLRLFSDWIPPCAYMATTLSIVYKNTSSDVLHTAFIL